MSSPLYNASIPRLKHMLGSLSKILGKAAEFAAARKIDPLVLTSARLFPDMFPLNRQVHIATDQAKGCAARLAGIDIPRYEDTETSIEELQARIAKTIDFLNSITPEQLAGAEQRDISFNIRDRKFEFKGEDYLNSWVIPNFYFHVTAAYAILRSNGVDIGKTDFLGG